MHYFQEWIALLYGCYAVIIAYLNKNIKFQIINIINIIKINYNYYKSLIIFLFLSNSSAKL